jgi:replicative DNA helicase
LETIKLKALLHIQKFIEDESNDDFLNPGGVMPGSNYRRLTDINNEQDARMYIQKGSKMNDGDYEDENPF